MAHINLGKSERSPILRRLGDLIDFVYEYAHMLLARTMGVHRAASLLRRFNLDSIETAGFNRIIGEAALHDKIRMPVVVMVWR